MDFEVGRIVPGKNFTVSGISYIGEPCSNTAMFVTKKVEHLISNLAGVDECLVFAEKGIEVPEDLQGRQAFHFSENPQLAYTKFANVFAREKYANERRQGFMLDAKGYYVSESSFIGENAYIEPGCVIGPDVHIGRDACILSGTVIRHATIGDGFMANECAVVGANGFAIAEDEAGNKLRVPTLGRVMIGDYVEVGAHNNISCGSAGNTVLEDHVKLDALVHLGHDVYIHRNTEVTAGAVIGGFAEIGEYVYIGINAVIRNRITVGDNAFIGMGSTVMKSVGPNVRVAGNPARQFTGKANGTGKTGALG